MNPIFLPFDKADLILIAQQYLLDVVKEGYVSCVVSNTYLFVPWYYQKHLPLGPPHYSYGLQEVKLIQPVKHLQTLSERKQVTQSSLKIFLLSLSEWAFP